MKHTFFNPRGRKTSAVDSGVNRGGGSGGLLVAEGKTYNDLPSDAKIECDRFVATIKGYTREKYVTDYFEED